MINQRIIIYLLVGIVAALLLLNVLLDQIDKSEKEMIRNNLSVKEIEEKFNLTLSEYGIESDWIIKRKISPNSFDSIKYSYLVSFPSDVSIPQFLKDLNYTFNEMPVEIKSEEKKINDDTKLSIRSNNTLKLLSELRYDNELLRGFSEIGFLLTEMNNATEADLQFLFYQGLPFSPVFSLSENSQELAEFFKNKDFDYYIKINEESDKIDFELDPEMGFERLTENIKNIISSFNSPGTFLIDEMNNFSQQTEDFLKEQFMKRERKLIKMSEFVKLKGENKEDLISLFQFYEKQLDNGDRRIFRINYADWILLRNSLNSFIKKGHKIIPPSKYL